MSPSKATALQQLLSALEPAAAPARALRALVERGLDRLPLPGAGATLERWQALAAVGEHDLSLAKLYEGHTDALAIVAELDMTCLAESDGVRRTWGVWAAEAPDGRTRCHADAHDNRRVRLQGTKCWCSGAADVTHALVTVWPEEGLEGPQLVAIDMAQAGIRLNAASWQAVGMGGSASIDVAFDGAVAWRVGSPGSYLSRPGFWQGGAGVAACWYGGARAVGEHLRQVCTRGGTAANDTLRLASLGRVDMALHGAAAGLREAAAWIDAHPVDDASTVALRARLAAEHCATVVLREVGRALGAAPFGREPRFARLAADLPVFIRQCHADRDLVALGRERASEPSNRHAAAWAL